MSVHQGNIREIMLARSIRDEIRRKLKASGQKTNETEGHVGLLRDIDEERKVLTYYAKYFTRMRKRYGLPPMAKDAMGVGINPDEDEQDGEVGTDSKWKVMVVADDRRSDGSRGMPGPRLEFPDSKDGILTAIYLRFKMGPDMAENVIWLSFGSIQLENMKKPLGARREVVLHCTNDSEKTDFVLTVDNSGCVDLSKTNVAPIRLVYDPVDKTEVTDERLEAAFYIRIKEGVVSVAHKPSEDEVFGLIFGRFQGRAGAECYISIDEVPEGQNKSDFMTSVLRGLRQTKQESRDLKR